MIRFLYYGNMVSAPCQGQYGASKGTKAILQASAGNSVAAVAGAEVAALVPSITLGV